MAEIELSTLSKQYLGRSIECMKELDDEVNAWGVWGKFNRSNSNMEVQ